MLCAADTAFWFHAPPAIVAQFPQFPAIDDYDTLLAALTGAVSPTLR